MLLSKKHCYYCVQITLPFTPHAESCNGLTGALIWTIRSFCVQFVAFLTLCNPSDSKKKKKKKKHSKIEGTGGLCHLLGFNCQASPSLEDSFQQLVPKYLRSASRFCT